MEALLNKISATVARAKQHVQVPGHVNEKEVSIRQLQLCKKQIERTKPSASSRVQCLIEDLILQLAEMETCLRSSITSEQIKTNGFKVHRHRTTQDGCKAKGASRYYIAAGQIKLMLSLNFSVTKIAVLLQVSRKTVTRRMKHLNIGKRKQFSNATDVELDEMIETIVAGTPSMGYRNVLGNLRAKGNFVQEKRVQQSLQRINPAALALRWGNTVRRRVYSVKSPQTLWHIDGNHKLIRWKMIVHGGIDGYSRLVVYLHAANNNLASTVLAAFQMATAKYGLPARVRMDQGVENNQVTDFMHQQRPQGRNVVLKGKSVHNQRIERLWLDVFKNVLSFYHDMFTDLENANLLDIGNDKHMLALHYVFLPKLQEKLNAFALQNNHHGLSTEQGQSPCQLWMAGALQNMNSNHSGIQGICDAGISSSLTSPAMPPEEISFRIPNWFSQANLVQLKHFSSTLSVDCVGVETYLKTLVYLCG